MSPAISPICRTPTCAGVDAAINQWRLTPAGSEGYRTAEVTVGGVDTNELDSRTMAVKSLPGLYFIGEVVDVTGWLGGYNFQWAWSSGWCAGKPLKGIDERGCKNRKETLRSQAEFDSS